MKSWTLTRTVAIASLLLISVFVPIDAHAQTSHSLQIESDQEADSVSFAVHTKETTVSRKTIALPLDYEIPDDARKIIVDGIDGRFLKVSIDSGKRQALISTDHSVGVEIDGEDVSVSQLKPEQTGPSNGR